MTEEGNLTTTTTTRRIRKRIRFVAMNVPSYYWILLLCCVTFTSLSATSLLSNEQNRQQVRHSDQNDGLEATPNQDQYVVHYQQSVKPKTTEHNNNNNNHHHHHQKRKTTNTTGSQANKQENDLDQRRQLQFEKILALAANVATVGSAIGAPARSQVSSPSSATNSSGLAKLQANAKAIAAATSESILKSKEKSKVGANARRGSPVASIADVASQQADLMVKSNSKINAKLSQRVGKEYHETAEWPPTDHQRDFDHSGFDVADPSPPATDQQVGSSLDQQEHDSHELQSEVKSAQLHDVGQTIVDGQPLPATDDAHNHHVYSATAPSSPSSDGSHAANIRVVFNNNPQFIIGSNTRESQADDRLHSLASSPLQRRTRQPASSLLHDDFRPDESALDETKVSVTSQQSNDDDDHDDDRHHQRSRPCDKQSKTKPNIEQVNLKEPQQVEEPPPPPIKSAPPAAKVPEQQPEQIPLPKAPTKQSKPPPAVKTQDEQVDTPIEQLVKSGVRPPLRMVISMRNKQGDIMKVPINLHGSIKPPVTVADQQQVQIQFEPQISVEQRPDVVQQTSGVDENTPIGGDVFDPSIVKAFPKFRPSGGTKTSRTPTKTQQRVEPDEPPPVIPQVVEQPPPPPTKQVPIEPVKRPQVVEQQPLPSPPPAVQTKTVQEPQVIEQTPQVKAPPPLAPPPSPPVKDCNHSKVNERPVVHLEPPATKQQEQQPVPVEQQQQQPPTQQQQQQEVVLPMSVDPNGDGIVQMMMPKLTHFQNKTFANMFTEFQRALQHQMANHLATQPRYEEQEQVTGQQQEHHEPQQQQQQQSENDEQEDLMVALMAANMSRPSHEGGHVAMTVIKPPKGTTLQQALMVHAAKEGAMGPTVAILQSGNHRTTQSMLNNMMQAGRDASASTSGAGQLQPNSMDTAVPVGIEITLRPPGRPNPGEFRNTNNNNLPEGTGEVDPDGFSSSISLVEGPRTSRFRPRKLRSSSSSRFKRSTFDTSLEPDDKLPKQSAKREPAKKISNSNKSVQSKVSSKAPKSIQDVKMSKSAQESKGNRKSSGKKPKEAFIAAASENEATSESSDADNMDDDSDQDGDDSSNSDSGNDGGNHDEEASASVPSGESASDDSSDYGNDLGGDDFGDDSGGGSGFGDSDDEPYNQAASSDRITDSSSFEIPTIDINPDTLQQKGCRTVLREVQEIPMDGLGVVQANGQPGSGYGDQAGATASPSSHQAAGLRVRRQAPANENLINSRKVTSIVMTKECHFPNESAVSKSASNSKHNSQRSSTVKKQPQSPQQHRVPFGGQGGASQVVNRQVVPLASPPSRTINQQQQTYLISSGPTGHIYTINNPQLPPAVAQINPNLLLSRPARTAKHQQSPKTANLHPQILQTKPKTGQLVSESSNVIRRRSVDQKQQTSSTASKQNSPPVNKQVARNNNDNLSSASRRNEVVAQKLYKPPSADDPYHTLSYSSSRGVDPDMEDDEDDNVVMGPDESRSESIRSRPGRGSQTSASRHRPRSGPTETLSKSELEALQDPDHDDTDPVGSGGPPNADQQQNSDPVDQLDLQHDADETDGDLSDESRPQHQRQAPLVAGRPTNNRGPLRANNKQSFGLKTSAPRHQQTKQSRVIVRDDRRPVVSREPDERFSKSFKFEREVSRPQIPGGLSSQVGQLKPGQQGFVSINGNQRPVAASAIARQIQADSREDRDPPDERYEDADDAEDDDDRPAERRRGGSSSAGEPPDADSDPDSDPEYNPKETHLPAHTKPKKVAKSFAYVHRDLPKKGAPNPDDFVVSYGRGNLQTEQEDYDSDRDQQEPTNIRQQQHHLRHPFGRNEPQRASASIKHEQVTRPPPPANGTQPITRPNQSKQKPPPSQDDSVRRKYMYPMSSRPILIPRWRR